MKRTNIYLEEEQSRLLRHIAVEQGRSFTDIVREALDDYLVRSGFTPPSHVVEPHKAAPDADWQRRMDAVLDRIRSAIPPGTTPEQVEEEITAAAEEMRAERAARTTGARG